MENPITPTVMPGEPTPQRGGPPELLVSQLQKVHPCYKAEKMQLYSDLMDPECFEDNKDKYLYKRQIEEGKPQVRARRVDSATYTPHLLALVNYLVTSVFQSAPAFVVTNGTNDYWTNLNDDADGAGHSLTEVAKKYLFEGMVQGRSYLSIDFPNASTDAPDLAAQKKARALDAYFCLKGAKNITYWQTDERGNLNYLRTHDMDAVEDPYNGISGYLHTWTFIFADHYQEYTAVQPLDANGKPKAGWENDPESKATAGPIKELTLGAVPVVPLETLHIVKMLAPLAKSLFNNEAAHDWLLQTSAYSQMVIADDNPLNENVSSELNIIKVGKGAEVDFPSPNPEHFKALSSQSDNKLRNLYLCLQSMPLTMSSKDSGGRQSGAAKAIDFTFVENLLATLAGDLKDKLRNASNLIKIARGEEALDIQIVGLDKFDVKGLVEKLELAQAIQALPVAEAAKKYVFADLGTTVTATADAVTRQTVQVQNKTLKIEPPPVSPIPPVAPIDTAQDLEDSDGDGE